jgi:hypothetical protein
MIAVTILTLPLDFILPRAWLGVRPGALLRACGWPLFPAALAAGAMTALAAWMRLPAIAETLVAVAAGGAIFLAAALALQQKRLVAALTELREKFVKGR